LYGWISEMAMSSMPVVTVFSWKAGIVRMIRNAAAPAAQSFGRRRTRVRTAFQNRASPVLAAEPADERDADLLDSVAEPGEQSGRTVSEPSMATATTIIVASLRTT
jgi:hypothetical protein